MHQKIVFNNYSHQFLIPINIYSFISFPNPLTQPKSYHFSISVNFICEKKSVLLLGIIKINSLLVAPT